MPVHRNGDREAMKLGKFCLLPRRSEATVFVPVRFPFGNCSASGPLVCHSGLPILHNVFFLAPHSPLTGLRCSFVTGGCFQGTVAVVRSTNFHLPVTTHPWRPLAWLHLAGVEKTQPPIKARGASAFASQFYVYSQNPTPPPPPPPFLAVRRAMVRAALSPSILYAGT